jgi:hypothetical protein
MTPPRPAARRRVSRQRYVVRRIGVGVVAVVALLGAAFGVVKGIGLLGGNSGENVAEGSSPDTTDTVGTGSSPASTAAPEGIVAPTSTAAPTAPPTTPAPTAPPVIPPSAQAPAKVLVVGDSDAGTFGPYLKELVDATGVAATTVDYKVSSGLARPDFFDWPAHLAETLPTEAPDLVVVTFGGNDAQGLSTVEGSDPLEWNDPVSDRDTWIAEYSRRAGAVMDMLAEGGRTVVWVGIPNDDNPEVTARMEVQNEGVKAALATRPNVQFVDTWTLFSSGNGGWAEYAIDPRDGQGKDVRASDGFHLNENGAEILAVKIADVIKADLQTRGAAI